MATIDLRRAKERYERTMVEQGVPEHLREGLLAHVLEGRPTGGFLTQCLADNLCGAVCRAGADIDLEGLRAVAKWLYNEAPPMAYGSDEAVAAWQRRGGEQGR